MNIEAQSTINKSLYKIVRLDDHSDIPGEIVAADENTGECIIKEKDLTKAMQFGARAIRVVPR